MTNGQDTNSKAQAQPGESLKDGAQTEVLQVTSTAERDALGDGALDDVSGGLWPQVMTGSSYNKTI